MRDIFAAMDQEFGSLHKRIELELLKDKIADFEDRLAARGTTDERFKKRMDNLKKNWQSYRNQHPKSKLSFQQWLQSKHKEFHPHSDPEFTNSDPDFETVQEGKVIDKDNDPGEVAKMYHDAKWRENRKPKKMSEHTGKDGKRVEVHSDFHHPAHKDFTPEDHRHAAIAHYKALKDLQKKHGLSHKQMLDTAHPKLKEDFLTDIRPEYKYHYEQLNKHRSAGGAPSAWIGPRGLHKKKK